MQVRVDDRVARRPQLVGVVEDEVVELVEEVVVGAGVVVVVDGLLPT